MRNSDSINQAYKEVCDDLDMLLEQIKGLMESSKGNLVPVDVAEKVYSKYFENGIPEIDNFNINGDIDFYTRNVTNPLIAPVCYERAFEFDHANAINLMKDYIETSSYLDKDDWLCPLRKLMSNDWAFETFDANLPFFLGEIVPSILQFGKLDDLHEIGITIIIALIDETYKNSNGHELMDDFFVEISFESDTNQKYYNYNYLKSLLTPKMKGLIGVTYDSAINQISFSNQVKEFKKNLNNISVMSIGW